MQSSLSRKYCTAITVVEAVWRRSLATVEAGLAKQRLKSHVPCPSGRSCAEISGRPSTKAAGKDGRHVVNY